MENTTPQAAITPETQNFVGLMPIKQIITESWHLFTRTWKTLVRIGVIVIAPAFLLAAMVMGIALAEYSVLAVILGVALVLVAIYYFSWAYAAVIHTLSLPEGQTIRARDAYKETASRVWPMVWVSILSSLIIAGGFILLIIPGIIFSVWYGLSRYIAITEKLSPVESLKRSRVYVDGYFWPVIIRMLVVLALSFGVSFVSEILSVVISFGSTIIADIISMIISAVWSLYSIIYGYKLYTAVKQAHEKKA